MDEGIFIAASGGMKQQRKLEVISNNLANLNTPGFKKDGLVFESILSPFGSSINIESEGIQTTAPFQTNTDVSYVGIAGFLTNHSQGPITNTGNTLDLALEGEGFFLVQTPNGNRYTRKGNFQLDGLGRLITKNGHKVLGDDGKPLVLEAAGKVISIDNTGTISLGKGLENETIGKLKIVRFDNNGRLVKEGNGLFRKGDPGQKEKLPDTTMVLQGFIENSNVNSVEEITNLIATHRVFQSYQKIIQAIDDMDGLSVNSIGRVA